MIIFKKMFGLDCFNILPSAPIPRKKPRLKQGNIGRESNFKNFAKAIEETRGKFRRLPASKI